MRVLASVIAIFAVVLGAHSAVADSGDDTMMSVIWGEWIGGGEFATIDAYSMVVLKSDSNRTFEYEVAPWTFVPLVYYRLPDGDGGEKDVINYNFRGPINWLAWAASSKLAGVDRHNDNEIMASPWCYALLAPNSLLRFRLHGNLKLVIGTRTDFLLYRTASTERGIMFTPQIGIDFSGGKYGDSNAYSGISVSVGLRNWWSFDGDNKSGGIAISARLWGIPFTH